MADLARRLNWAWPGARDWLAHVAAWPVVPTSLRHRLLGTRGHRFGVRAQIWPGTLVLGSGLTMGRDAYINRNCLIDAADRIVIGDDVHIAARVHLVTTSHRLGDAVRRAGEFFTEPIEVQDGCWIGADVLVLPGVTIGAGSVVAAGAVVTTDIAPNTLAAGVPARAVREL